MSVSLPADPSSYLDYTWDWTAWLAAGETIAAHAFTATAPVMVDQDAHDTTTVTAWVRPGAVVGRALRNVTCRITTSASRVDERTITLDVRNR